MKSLYTLEPCGGNICATVREFGSTPGLCVPGPDTVALCAKSLGNGCECPVSESNCKDIEIGTIMDIYISNKTDQTLHLLKGGDKISITDTSGNQVRNAAVGWMSSGALDYTPPQTIETAASGAEPAFIRGYVKCFDVCCTEETIFSIELQYSIGVPDKKLGNLVIPVCRTKPKGKPCLPTVTCDKAFGNITTCSGAEIAINPLSGTYKITAATLRETQAVIEISGGTMNGNGGTGCTVSPDSCPSGQTCNPNTLKCETSTTGGLSNRQFTILIVVSIVAVLLVILFFGFLIFIRNRGEKKK